MSLAGTAASSRTGQPAQCRGLMGLVDWRLWDCCGLVELAAVASLIGLDALRLSAMGSWDWQLFAHTFLNE